MDLRDLGVTGAAGANLFIGGVFRFAAHVARDDGVHAVELLKHGFDAPEAASAKGCGFQIFGVDFAHSAGFRGAGCGRLFGAGGECGK